MSALLLASLLGLLAFQGEAAGEDDVATRLPASTWRVATKPSAPFAYQNSDGSWKGVSVELAEQIAERLGVRLELVSIDSVEGLLDAVSEGRADAAIAAISVTPEREARVDFSHPYYTAGLGVAVRSAEQGFGFRALLRALTSREFLQIIAVVVLALAGIGVLFWLAEHKRHPQFKEGGATGSVGTGIWWSTIIFLGHKGVFPKSVPGAILAATCMVASILLFSVLTGAVASVLTVHSLESPIRGVDDLRLARTVAVRDTSAARFLAGKGVYFGSVADPSEGLRRIQAGTADAMVHDAPLLQHLQRTEFRDLQIVSHDFDVRDYAIAFALDSPWRKPVNRALLEIRDGDSWGEILYRYLGP